MHLEHFELSQYPFSLVSDLDFFLDRFGFADVLDVLDHALLTGEGFVKVIGDAGTGKTLMCRKLMDALDKRFLTVHISHPYLGQSALLMALADALSVKHGRNINPSRLLDLIRQRLLSLQENGKHVVLILDEAEALPDDGMDDLRLISNLESDSDKLLQIVLFAQPGLNVRLRQARLRPLEQRILYGCQLRPLTLEEVSAYLDHRLRVAGHSERTLFGFHALASLHRASGGVPRLINVLAHKAMLCAYGRGEHVNDSRHVHKAIADSDGISTRGQSLAPKAMFFGSLGLATAGRRDNQLAC